VRTGTTGSVPVMCAVAVCYKTLKKYAAAVTFQQLCPSNYVFLSIFGMHFSFLVAESMENLSRKAVLISDNVSISKGRKCVSRLS
jgi:hypothetical protein